MIVGNWAEDDAAYRNIGRNLLGDEDATAVGRSTQRRDYTSDGKFGVGILDGCRRADREPKPLVEMAHKFPHGVPGRPNGRYDATVSDLAFAAPAADKGKVSEGLWTGRNSNDARVPRGADGGGALSAAKKAAAAAEMAGFDPYVTTTATAMAMGVGAGPVERRSTIMPSRAAEGGQPPQVGRRAVGGFAEEFDRGYHVLGLRR